MKSNQFGESSCIWKTALLWSEWGATQDHCLKTCGPSDIYEAANCTKSTKNDGEIGCLARFRSIHLKVEETIKRYNNMDKQEKIEISILIFSWDKLLCQIIKKQLDH